MLIIQPFILQYDNHCNLLIDRMFFVSSWYSATQGFSTRGVYLYVEGKKGIERHHSFSELLLVSLKTWFQADIRVGVIKIKRYKVYQ
jgi:hypothetical protein